MNLSLYKIEEEYALIAHALLEAGGETTPELEEALALNQEQLQNKAVNYGFVIMQLEGDVDVIDAQIKRLQALKVSRTKTADKLRAAIEQAMQHYTIEKIESPVMKMSLRKSEAVEIENETMIPVDKYMKEKITIAPDKALIKEALKAGEIVPGARLQTNYNLQIK